MQRGNYDYVMSRAATCDAEIEFLTRNAARTVWQARKTHVQDESATNTRHHPVR